MKTYRLLVAAGNYDIIHQVRQSLTGQFVLSMAYSHTDTLYAVRSGCDALLIDAAMYDRRTGHHTAEAVRATYPQLPMIVYVGDQTNGWERRLSDALALTTLEERGLRSVVLRALRVPAVSSSGISPPQQDTRPILTEPLWRSEEIKTLFALGRSLTEVLELSEVLNRVVEAARKLTHADEGMILLPDAETGDLYLRARVGIDSDVARNFRVKTHDSLAGHVFNTGEPVIIGARGPQKVKTEYFVNALLYVPILVKGKPIGVLGVNNRSRGDVFSSRDEELLVNLASYAAVSIENARIHGQSVKRTRELKVLVEATQAINASLVIERTLPTICQQMIRLLDVSYAEIFTWERPHNRLYSEAFCTMGRWRQGHELTRNVRGYTMLLQAIQADQPVLLVQDTLRDNQTDLELHWLTQENGAALHIIPLPDGHIVLAWYSQIPVVFPGTLEEARKLACDLPALLTSSQPTLALRKNDEICRLLNANWCEYTTFQADSQSLITTLRTGEATFNGRAAGRGWTLNIDTDCEVLRTLENHDPLIIHERDTDLGTTERTLLKHTKTRVLLALPLIQRGQSAGLMVFGDVDVQRTFSLKEIELARAVMAQAATALENARLVHDLERSLRELKETQSRLIQTARLSAMGELAAAVAHQINNPLTTIVLDTELLQDNPSHDPETQVALDAIARAGKRAAGVVRRMLATVRPSNGDMAKMEPVDLIYTLEETVALVRSHIERSGIALQFECSASGRPIVRAIPGELDDVWLNLLLNAHDALAGRAHPVINVMLSCENENDHVQVKIADNGPGIPEQIINDIFKPFFTTKPLGEGTGLGLHICRQVVDRVGGHMVVESEPELGTQFIVYLPVIQSEGVETL